jgi:hypothetical protein
MCQNCRADYNDVPVTTVITEVSEMINGLREINPAFGYAHVVFDDWNLDLVDSCLDDALNNTASSDIDDEERFLTIQVLQKCKLLSDDEIAKALAIAEGWE